MKPKLSGLSPAEVLAAQEKSLGRPWSGAEYVQVTDFGDCARADFWWSDGALVVMMYDTKAEALDALFDLGFE